MKRGIFVLGFSSLIMAVVVIALGNLVIEPLGGGLVSTLVMLWLTFAFAIKFDDKLIIPFASYVANKLGFKGDLT